MKKVSKYLLLFFLLIAFLYLGCERTEGNTSNQADEKKHVTKEQKSNSIEGKYVLPACDHARFSISISNIKDKNIFKIYDRNKVISSGAVHIDEQEDPKLIKMGKIEGAYYGDSIILQNHGNSMNAYIHFVQCNEKYLTFIKEVL